MKNNQNIMRGDIYFANLNPVVGSEQGGTRPILIVQNDVGNKHSPTVIAAAITSRLDKPQLPTHVEIEAGSFGMDYHSIICLEQIRTIDKSRLGNKAGHLDDEAMKKVEDALNISLGIKQKKEGQAVSNLKLSVPVEFQNQRVLTTQQIADGYGIEPIKIQQNYSNNRERYIAGTHYYVLEGDALKAFKRDLENFEVAPNVNRFFLWTEKGALLHAKSLNTDKAWEVYQELVDTYFRAKELTTPQTQIQILQQAIAVLAEQEKEIAVTKQIATDAKAEATAAKESLTEIKNTIAELPADQWRKWINSSLCEIGIRIGNNGQNHEEIRSRSYKLLEERAGADLAARVRNGRKRLENSGATKTSVENYRKLDAIEEDKRLKEIYTGIVKELRIKYLV